MINVARLCSREYSEDRRHDISSTGSQQERLRKIEQLIQEHDSYGTDSSEGLNSYSESNIDLFKNNDEKNEDLKFYKHIMLNNLISKPMGQLNCCYTFVENFYSSEKTASLLKSSNDAGDYHQVYESNEHQSQHSKSQLADHCLDNNFDENASKYNTIYHANYEINTLKCICEEKVKDSQASKNTKRAFVHNENKNIERFYHIFFSLKNIVRSCGVHFESDEIESITLEIVEQIMDKSQNLLYLEGSNFPFKLPQIRDFKYRKDEEVIIINFEPSFCDKFKLKCSSWIIPILRKMRNCVLCK